MLSFSYSIVLLGVLLSVLNDSVSAYAIIPRTHPTERQRTSLNSGWRFSRFTANPDSLSYDTLKPWILPSANVFISGGDKYERPAGAAPGANVSYVQPDFNDEAWEAVTLPHDWAIAGPFNAPGIGGGMATLPVDGVGYYRRTVSIASELIQSGNSIFLDIDGAMAYSAVWLNGHLVGGWPYGYNSYRLDLTPYAKAAGGDNTLVIRLENKPLSSRWYPGAGIYRNVWLVTASPVHVAQYGTYVTTPSVSAQEATIHMMVDIENMSNSSQHVEVVTEIYEVDSTTKKATGGCIATIPAAMADVAGHGNKQSVSGSVTVQNPKLWGPPPNQTPSKYIAISTLSIDGTDIDVYETIFGIRSVVFDPNQGVIINGERVRIQGSNVHHDQGSIGAAWNNRAAERQMEILVEMGHNALRTSHNPPAPEFLDLTDQKGLMVIDEIWDAWNYPKRENDFHLIFPTWHEPDTRAFIRRDRNHPSVISWSIGNEIPEQRNSTGVNTARTLQNIVHEEDSTRLVTMGLDRANETSEISEIIDVIGTNYQGEGRLEEPSEESPFAQDSQFPSFHQAFPEKMIWSTESASTISSRGIYLFPVTTNITGQIAGSGPGEGGDVENHQFSSYDLYSPVWASGSPDHVFAVHDENPYVAGEFVWSGFDYLGEPQPYTNYSRSSFFGIVDLAGFKKDRFYLYQSRWRPDLPMAHLLPHWTWPERIGNVTPVHVYTSGDEGELFVNGVSAGRKHKGNDYRLRWDNVTYSPGSIEVITYKNGSEWATASHTTAGEAASLNVTADRTSITGDGLDLSYITVAVMDSNGTMVPTASDIITFEISGPGVIVSTDNGDPSDKWPFPQHSRNAFSGMALAIVKTEADAQGEIVVEAKSDGLSSGQVVLTAV